jgi:excinuclease ABC subunit C
MDDLREFVKDLPQGPGVYLMKSSNDKIIYVGKAKVLRSRVRSYFQENADHTPKTKILVQHISKIDFILTKTEVEAFLLEASLIKKHRPKYNIRLKDDKSYPYICLSMQDSFPKLSLSRTVKKDGSYYFGPYTSGAAVFGTIRFLNRTFKIRDCADSVFKSRTRPCMTYQIGRCTAPCVKLITPEDYRSDIEGALLFLKGEDKKIIKGLRQRMIVAANEEKFEVAARIRDNMESIKSILEKQVVVNEDQAHVNQDIVSYYGEESGVVVQFIYVRAGRVLGTRSHFIPDLNPKDPAEDIREWFVSFLNQYYEDSLIPDEVGLGVDLGLDVTKLFAAVLKERAGGRAVKVRFATDEKGAKLVRMAEDNAKEHFKRLISKSHERMQGLIEIQKKLHLSKIPKRMECYDISHFQGSHTVASQVTFEEGTPLKEAYRRYKLKSIEGVNDFASMKEVLTRRLAHHEIPEPDLIVIDGGKGQLNVAVKVLKELGRSAIPLVGIAKARTKGEFSDQEVRSSEERFFLPGRQNPVIFATNSEALRILTGIRDEAHRFAITYHRKLRRMDFTTSARTDPID